MQNFDFVIVGGGLAGCTLAYDLRLMGHSVAVIDRARIGRATSAINQGGIRQQFFQRHNIQAGLETVRRLDQVAEEVDIDYRKNGYLLLISEAPTLENFVRAVAAQNDIGVPTKVITAAEARSLVPNLAIDGVIAATFCATDGYVDPAKATQAYRVLGEKAGVVFFEKTDITAFNARGSGIASVDTTRGRFGCGKVVNAAGPWAGQLGRMIGEEIPVSAFQSSIFLLAPGHRDYTDIPLTIDIDHRVTLCPHPDGIMVGDARKPEIEIPGASPLCDWTRLAEVKARAGRRLPDLAQAQPIRGWAGYWEVTPDDNPIADFCFYENFYVYAGFSGHGMSIIPGLAKSIASDLVGDVPDIDIEAFRMGRFKNGVVHSTEIWGGNAIANVEFAKAV